MSNGGVLKCQSCGADNRPGDAFCIGCGKKLAAAPPGAPAPPQKAPGAMPPHPPAQPGAAAGRPPVAPPPAPGMVPPPPGMPQQQVVPQQQVTVVQHAVAGANSGLCIAALVTGIVGVVFCWVPVFGIILGILAVVFGAIGINIANKRGQLGKGMGIAGLVLGIVDVALNVILWIVIWGLFESAVHYTY